MKTFQQFQEDISKLPGLGGGGGGTNSITDKSPAKSIKKRVIDAGKMATVPARFLLNIKSKPDPTEKFADSYKTPKEKVSSAIRDYKKQKKVNEGVASLALKGGSKLIPALMTGIGAAGTIMQAKRKYRTRLNPGKRNSGRVLSPAEKKIFDKSQRDTDQKVTDQKPRDKVVKKILDRNAKKNKERMKIPNRIQSDRRRIERGLEKGEIMLDQFTPTNNVGGGQIAGTVEAGDNPPVKKKKKTYAYGGRGSRKMWMNNK